MQNFTFTAGATSKTIKLFAQSSLTAVITGLTGLAFNTASLQAYYIRDGEASATAITLATATLGTWTSGGFKVVDATNMPGMYELGVPDAVLAAGVPRAFIYITGALNLAPLVAQIDLTAVDFQNATSLGLSRLDAAVSSRAAAASLPNNLSTLMIDGSGNIAGSIGSVAGNISGSLTATERNAISDALLDRANAIESAVTPRLALRYAASALGGVLAGAATNTVTIQGIGVATNRITATVDQDGNRSAVVLA